MDGSLRPDHICTTDHTGTSASAPLAAGICALALEANPDLTWRDMQHIVVRTSRHNPLNREEGWFVNGVGNYVSHKFGYGLMDAGKMVDLAIKWTTVPPQHVCQTNVHRSEQTIPTIRASSVRSEITTDGCAGTNGEVRYLEHVQARVSLRFLPRGNINIKLISPSGTHSTLLFERPRDVLSEKFDDWPFLSVHYWGEKAAGTWQLIVTNAGARIVKEPGVLLHWQLILHGTKDHPERLRFPPNRHTFNPDFNQFGGIIFSESVKDEVKEPLDNHRNSLNKEIVPKASWNDVMNVTIGTLCHSECLGGCYGLGPNNCRDCKHYSLQEECVHTCPEGTYSSEEKDCLPCHGSCSQCMGPRQNQCSTCYQSLFVAHLGLCVDDCPVGYFAENGSCVKCGSQCALCSSKTNCTQCDHHLLLYNGFCHTVCPKRHFENDYFKCDACHTLCASCIGKTHHQCASCDGGLFFYNGKCVSNCPKGTYGDPVNQVCTVCPIGCASCNKEYCAACNKGWRLKHNFCVAYKSDNCKLGEYSDRRGMCKPCHETCLNCVGPTDNQCSHCKSHLVMHGNNCISECPQGYFRHRGRCLPCSPGCVSCKSYIQCLTCLPKYHLLNYQCVSSCSDGYYSDRLKCTKCDPTCSTCWGPRSDQCLNCKEKLVQLESSCTAACPLGFYESNHSCLPCFHNCRSCNGTGIHSCTSCSDYFTLEDGMCLECRTGRYFNSTTHSCQPCHDKCLTCSENSQTSCTSCQAPLSLHPPTSSCRVCCSPGVKEELYGECCKCDPSTGKCLGSATTDKKRIATNPPYSERYEAQPSIIFGSTAALVVIICLVNVLVFGIVFGTLQLRSKGRGNAYSYQPLPLKSTAYHDRYLLTKLTSIDDDSDDTEYSPLHTKT